MRSHVLPRNQRLGTHPSDRSRLRKGPMHTVAVISRKGGAGKTTLAVHLAAVASRFGQRSAIVDLDPQASAAAWSDLREDPRPAVQTSQPHRISQTLKTLRGCDLVIIDTAPHVEVGALAAARSADIVLLPCRPSYFDLHALDAVLDILRLADAEGVAVLNAVPPRGQTAAQARDRLASWGIEVLAPALGQRQAFVHSLNAGLAVEEYEPRGKAAVEVRALHAALMRRLGGPRRADTGR